MPIDVGEALFKFVAENKDLIAKGAQAEAAAKKNYAEIAKSAGVSASAVERAAQREAAAVQRFSDARAAATLKIIKADNDAAASAQKLAGAQQNASASALSFVKAGAGFIGAAAGIAGGAALIHQAMTKIATETQKASQAQFALNAVYREATPIVTEFANAQAKSAGRSNSDAQLAIATTRILTTQYGYTQEQIKIIAQRSADLAAIQGTDLVETTRDVTAALRLEGDVAEKYGLALQQDAIQASLLTKAERDRYQGLDPLTKSQITYTKFLQQSEYAQGQAAKRAQEATGQFDRLKANTDNLSVSVGKVFAPTVATASGKMADLVEQTTKMVDATAKLPEQQNAAEKSLAALTLGILRSTGATGAAVAGFIELQHAMQGVTATGVIQVGPDPGLPGSGPGTTPAQAAAALEGRNAAKRAAADERDRQAVIARVRARAREIESQAGIEMAEAEHDRAEKDVERRRILAEVEKENKIRALDAAHKVAMSNLEEEQRAAEKANKASIDRAELERDARIAAAEEARDQLIEAIEAVQEAQKLARETEDRETDDRRESVNRQIEDAREQEDHERETSHRDEMRQLEERHETILDGLKAEEAAAEKASRSALRNIERQIDRARKKSADAIDGIEREAAREQERHRKAVQNISDEQDRALAAIDAQLRALDDAERGEDNAGRLAGLQGAVTAAQLGLARAQPSGSPADLAAARDKLTRAIRIGDPEAEAKARDELIAISGQGAEAIKKASEDVAAAQKELRDEGVKQSRDAERQKLRDAQDAIKTQADAERRDEDDRNRRRERDVARDKDAEQEKLEKALSSLEKRKQKAQDNTRDEIEGIRARVDEEGKAYEAAVELATDEYDERTRLLGIRREDENRALADLREAEERERKDRRDAEDLELRHRGQEADKARDADIVATRAYYDGPNGIITQLKAKSEEIRLEYQTRSANLRSAYEVDKQTVADLYRNSAKTGILDKMDAELAHLGSVLELEKARWQKHKEDLTGDQGIVTQTVNDIMAQFARLNDVKVKVTAETTVRGGSSRGITSVPEPGQGDQSGGAGGGGGGVVAVAHDVRIQ